jgi:hypothetical protein
MFSTQRHNRTHRGMSISRVLQTWAMAFVILLAGVTQSGLIPALLGGYATGISQARAADAYPGSNVVLICTPGGIKPVNLADGIGGDASTPESPPNAGHAFCSLCATHHGAMLGVGLPNVVGVAVIHDVGFATANGIATGHEIPRVRHSRAPPVAV